MILLVDVPCGQRPAPNFISRRGGQRVEIDRGLQLKKENSALTSAINAIGHSFSPAPSRRALLLSPFFEALHTPWISGVPALRQCAS